MGCPSDWGCLPQQQRLNLVRWAAADGCPTLTNLLVIVVGGIPIAMPTVLRWACCGHCPGPALPCCTLMRASRTAVRCLLEAAARRLGQISVHLQAALGGDDTIWIWTIALRAQQAPARLSWGQLRDPAASQGPPRVRQRAGGR